MEFFKKSVVLKQTEKGYSSNEKPLSGIARIETESGVSDFYLTIINARLLSDATFKVGILNGDSLIVFELGKRPSSFHATLENFICANGFSIGLFVEQDDIPLTVAFAQDGACNISLTDFKKAVAEKCLLDRKAKQKSATYTETQTETYIEHTAKKESVNQTPPAYDDEAVATVNYYDLESNDNSTIIKENIDVQYEDELPVIGSQEETQQVADFLDRFSNETDLNFSKEPEKEQPYYRTVEKELNNIFSKFPREVNLEKLFLESKFAKINYSKDKYYVVGLIKENGKEKYICYGVPAVYSPEPPKELKGFCSFIPLSVFCFDGDGYWMMFQDAESGNCINSATI